MKKYYLRVVTKDGRSFYVGKDLKLNGPETILFFENMQEARDCIPLLKSKYSIAKIYCSEVKCDVINTREV